MPDTWSIHQITEFFDAVTSTDDAAEAARVAVERATETLTAEFGIVVGDTSTLACVGLGRIPPPPEALRPARSESDILALPRIGDVHVTSAPLEPGGPAHLTLGRVDGEFGSEERQLVHGMARALGLAMRSKAALADERRLRNVREQEAGERLRLIDTLGQRQRLLESLLAIQRAISHRAPLQRVLDTVARSASELLNHAYTALVLDDACHEGRTIAATSGGAYVDPRLEDVVLAVAAESASADRVVGRATGLRPGITIAAPVHIEGVPTGSLVAMSEGTDRDDLTGSTDTLAAFAEQASLALTDARTVEFMRTAHIDQLTNLPNRTLFLDTLATSLVRAERNDTSITVLFIDLDRFKDVNDTLGHAAGDMLLTQVARRIRGCLRSEDVAARIGGDEFAVMLKGDADNEGRRIAQRILDVMHEPVVLDGREVLVFVSIGIAASGPDASTCDIVLRNADSAMYVAKRAGARRAVEYEPSMHAETVRTLELRGDLSRAVEQDELRLVYQPLIDLAQGAPTALEALVRWEHPRFGLIAPNVLIPIAETNGTIVEIGEWVLREACRQTALWRMRSWPELTISVNVSARQLDDAGFGDSVTRALAESGLPAQALTLEVTESALMRDPDLAVSRLQPLREIGVRLAIDDFGTGYSSLAWLQHFPADQLKIDKSFVDSIETSENAAAIVRTVAGLAQILNLETVAEGIETVGQHHILRTLRCDLGQGYVFARPLSVIGVEEYLAATVPSTSAVTLRSVAG